MNKGYFSIADENISETVINKSRFICHLKPVKSVDEANRFIAEIKKKYYDATHNCSAYIIGDNSEYQKFSDDGEPQGTAGLPMLEVLQKNNLTYVCAIVTRYFGGIKLGAGGLVRAYSSGVSDCLSSATIVESKVSEFYRLKLDYNTHSKVEKIINSLNLEVLSVEYLEQIVINFVTTDPEIQKKLVDICNGKCEIQYVKTDFYNFKSL